METKAIDNNTFTGLENLSLKLHIAKRNLQDAQQLVHNSTAALQSAAIKSLTDAGLSPEEWALDLDRSSFVKKESLS